MIADFGDGDCHAKEWTEKTYAQIVVEFELRTSLDCAVCKAKRDVEYGRSSLLQHKR